MFKKVIIFLILLKLPFFLGCATAPKELDKTPKSSYNIITKPSGAKIVISKMGENNTEYISPSPISLINGFGFIEITKDGYWDEDRLVMQGVELKIERQLSPETGGGIAGGATAGAVIAGTMAGAVAGGAAGGLIFVIPDLLLPQHKSIQKVTITDHTRMQIDILDRKFSGKPSDYRSNLNGNTVEIELKEIPPPLKPMFSSLKINSETNYKEVSNRVDKLLSEEKISKEENLRAKKKFNDVYYGKFQRRN